MKRSTAASPTIRIGDAIPAPDIIMHPDLPASLSPVAGQLISRLTKDACPPFAPVSAKVMPYSDQVNWQPVSEMPLIARLIDAALNATREHLQTLGMARAQPHLLDDATIDRVEQVHQEQREFIDIYAQQINRWRTEAPSDEEIRELARMEAQNQQLQALTGQVLALARELHQGTIDRIMGMGDLELGLQALLGHKPGRRA